MGEGERMMEKGILFNTEMVRAILEGRKTMTRRVINHIGNSVHIDKLLCDWGLSEKPEIIDGILCWELQTDVDDSRTFKIKLPYQVGDMLYVRETWGKDKHGKYHYRADFPEHDCEPYPIWHPSIHMPKSAARIWLKVTDVRVKRLQDITEEDAIREGCKAYGQNNCSGTSARIAFAELWDSLLPPNKNKFKCPENEWRVNPWVWVIEFERTGGKQWAEDFIDSNTCGWINKKEQEESE